MMLHDEERSRMIKAYEENGDASRTASDFSVSISTVYRLRRQMRETGSVALRLHERGRKPILSEEDLQRIRDLLETHRGMTINEVRKALNLTVSYSTVERAIRKLDVESSLWPGSRQSAKPQQTDMDT